MSTKVSVLAVFFAMICMLALSAIPVQAATRSTIRPETCTPNNYQGVNSESAWAPDGTWLGSVNLLADGCGWVQANAYAATNVHINHIRLFDTATGQQVNGPSGMNYEETYHVKTNGHLYQARAAFQLGSVWKAQWSCYVTDGTGWVTTDQRYPC